MNLKTLLTMARRNCTKLFKSQDGHRPCIWPVDESGAAWSNTGQGMFQIVTSLQPRNGAAPPDGSADEQKSRCKRV